MSTPTHRKKRAKTTGTNATNDTTCTETATENNVRSHSQNLTSQMNDMKNEFDMKLSQVTNIQRDQQYQLEILRSENTKLVNMNKDLHLLSDENKELRRQMNQVKEKMDSDKTEYEAKMNDFKKQPKDMEKDSTSSRSGSSAKAVENDELSNAEPSTVIQRMKSRLPTIINDVKNIKITKKLSLQHGKCTNGMLVFTSKNNEKMIATGDGKYIKITQLENNNLVKTIEKAHSRVITSLVMTKINNTDVIASGSYDKMVKLWRMDNFKEVASFKCNDSVSYLTAYELNGKYMLACGMLTGSIELWDVQSKNKVDTLIGHVNRAWKLNAFKYQNKTYLLSGDEYGKLNLWCLDDNKKLLKTLCCGNANVDALASFEFDNDLFIAVGLRKKVMLWRMSNLEPHYQFDLHHFRTITGLKPFMSNEKVMLTTVTKDGWFCFLDIQNKKVVHEFKCTDHKFSSLDVCEEDGNSVFIAGGYNRTKKGSVVFLK